MLNWAPLVAAGWLNLTVGDIDYLSECPYGLLEPLPDWRNDVARSERDATRQA
jgi:hypothetical protein